MNQDVSNVIQFQYWFEFFFLFILFDKCIIFFRSRKLVNTVSSSKNESIFNLLFMNVKLLIKSKPECEN